MKKFFLSLLVVILLSLTFVNIVYAYELNSADAKSIKDPLFIEMPDNLHVGKDYTIKIYINDPIIKKEAEYIVFTGSNYPYSINSKKFHYDSGGYYRIVMPYNGEDFVEFGYRILSMPGPTSSLGVSFSKAKKAPSMDYPDVHNPDSEFYRYNCHLERNDLFCTEKNGCHICHIIMGAVSRQYIVSPSKVSFSLPEGDFEDNVKPKDDGTKSGIGQSFSYSKKTPVFNSRGTSFDMTDSYSIRIDISDYPQTLEDKMAWVSEYSAKQSNLKIQKTGVSGEIFSGEAFEKISYNSFNPQSDFDSVSLNYEIYAELSPKKSGIMTLEVKRIVTKEKGYGQEEIEKVISDAKKVISSFSISEDKKNKADDLFHFYEVTSKVVQEDEDEELDLRVYGTIKDGLSRPIPYITYVIQVNNKNFEGVTDKDGKFNMPLTGLEFKESETEIPVKFYVDFLYKRDGKEYFWIYGNLNGANNFKKVLFVKDDYKIIDFEDLEINFDFSDTFDPDVTGSSVDFENLKFLSVIFYHSHESVEFMIDRLKANIDYKLPLKVVVGNNQGKTLYSPSDGKILISASDASISSKNRPDNREYHEWAHHLMFAEYGSWPKDRSLPNTKNHDGFFNPSTADSYMEGFAEFWAMVISEHFGEKEPDIYAGFGSMEEDYKPWDARGFYEELAIASLLWDMYDSNNEEGDRLSLTVDEMWDVLKVKRDNFYEYYKAFQKEFPNKKKDIDDIFIKHGFFIDTRIGNKSYDAGEPWKYIAGNSGAYKFIDMSGNVSNIFYNNSLTIGTATNYERLNRTQAVTAPNSFIYVPDDEIYFYTVKVEHKDKDLIYEYVTTRADNKIYVSPLPSDSNAKITINPLSTKYTSDKPLTISSQEWNSLVNKGSDKGYVLTHEFNLKDNGKKEEHVYELFAGVKPNYDYKGDLEEKVNFEIDEKIDRNIKTGSNNLKSYPKGFIFFLFLIIIIVVFIYFYAKNKNFKKSVNHNSKTFFNFAFKTIKDFIIWLYNKIKSLFDKKKEKQHKKTESKKNKK
jgi:hypothetical protein